jgi:adenylate cyclase
MSDRPDDEYTEALEALGVDREAIAHARTKEQLGLLAIEQLMAPGVPRYNEAEVAELSGVPVEISRRLWRALGFPDPPPDEPVFSDADVEMLRPVAAMLKGGDVDPDVALQMTRVVGSSMARIAEAYISAIVERLRQGGDIIPREGGGLLTVHELINFVFQRQMQAAARRRLGMLQAGEGGAAALAVGFADLVGFTALSQQVSDRELAQVVDRFEAVAFDTVAALGGRVVKMIGDEVMFATHLASTAAEIALTLSNLYENDEELSEVRVGLAYGPVLEREGDLYGPVVNLASRVVNLAYPGTVVVSDDVHESLAGDPRFAWRSMRRRYLKDIGRVPLWVLRWADDDDGDQTRDTRQALARIGREVVRQQIADRMRAQADRIASTPPEE